MTEGFRDLRIQDDEHYALSSSVPPRSAGRESHIERSYDDTQPGPSTFYYPSRERDPIPPTGPADPFYGRAQPSSEYHQTQGYDVTPTAAYPSNVVEAQPDLTTSQYYPTQQNLSPSQPSYAVPVTSAYHFSQQGAAIVDARQQTNPPSRGNPKAQQKLDASFYVRNHDYKKFFRVGKVFMTLWSDQLGSTAEQGSFVSDVIYGERVYSKVRRFIVVRPGADKRSATCLPITSYRGTGLSKSGIQLGEHGFIYSKREPEKVSGMCSKALRVHLSPKAPDLINPSLVHYGKVHTVEGNWKVKDIGDLDSDSRKLLLHYFRKVFGFLDDDLPEPGMTPRAKEAVLAHIGAGLDHYPTAPTHGAHQTTTATQQHFASTSPPDGYPPTTTHESFGGTRGSTAYEYPASTRASAYSATSRGEYNTLSTQNPSSYSTTPYHTTSPYPDTTSYQNPTSTQGAASYQGYSVAIASGRTVSNPSYYSQGPTTTNYYSQHTAANPQAGGGTAYQTYEPHQVQQSWSPVGTTMATGYTSAYGYSTAGPGSQGYATAAPPYQDPNGQYGSAAEGTAGTAYTRPSDYDESAIAQGGSDDDIPLPSLAEVQREKSRRDSKTGGGSNTGNRRRRHERDDRDDRRR